MTSNTASHSQLDIVSIGGATFDIFICAPHEIENGMIQFPLGGKVKVESVKQGCGGGGANTSVGFARLGMNAGFCGVIADDEWGRQIQRAMNEEGVSTDMAIIVEGEISSFSVVLVDKSSGRRSIIYAPNVNAHICDPVFPKEHIKTSKWIFLNHLTDASCVILDDIADIVCEESCRLAWNPGGSQISDGLDSPIVSGVLANADILFLNAEEACRFTRTKSVMGALAAGTAGGAKVMCITDGADGAYISDGNRVWRCKSAPVSDIVDTTGAGDAFASGVTWAVAGNMSLSDALRAGIINSASVIQHAGAQTGLLTESDISRRLEDIGLSVSDSVL